MSKPLRRYLDTPEGKVDVTTFADLTTEGQQKLIEEGFILGRLVPAKRPVKANLAPSTLPDALRANTPARMESHERGFTHAGNLYVDRSERVWLSADAFVVREFDTYYCIAVRRVDNGATIEVPDNIRFVPANECPFEAVLPVLHIEIVPDAE